MQTQMQHLRHFGIVALALAFAGIAFAQSSQTNIGTWKLNLAKSTYSAGTAPKSGTFTNEVDGAGINTTSDSVTADGTAMHSTYTVIYDGKEKPITGKTTNGDVVSATRIDPNSVRSVYKKDGKVTVTMTSVVSKDGKVLTLTIKGTNTLGQTINTVAVYDKQ